MTLSGRDERPWKQRILNVNFWIINVCLDCQTSFIFKTGAFKGSIVRFKKDFGARIVILGICCGVDYTNEA